MNITQGQAQTLTKQWLEATGPDLDNYHLLYYKGNFTYEHLTRLWCYFRSVEQTSLEKYGPPPVRNCCLTDPEQSSYDNIWPMFKKFIEYDTKDISDKPLVLIAAFEDVEWQLFRNLPTDGFTDGRKFTIMARPISSKHDLVLELGIRANDGSKCALMLIHHPHLPPMKLVDK